MSIYISIYVHSIYKAKTHHIRLPLIWLKNRIPIEDMHCFHVVSFYMLLWCMCADVGPASLQQGVRIWSRWIPCCFSKGLGWPQINPLVFSLLTATLLEGRGLTRICWLGDTAVDKSLSNYTGGTVNPSLMCSFVWVGHWGSWCVCVCACVGMCASVCKGK